MTGGSDVFFWVENLHARYFFGSRDLSRIFLGLKKIRVFFWVFVAISGSEKIQSNFFSATSVPEKLLILVIRDSQVLAKLGVVTIFFTGWGQIARLQRVRQNTADRIQTETEQQQTARLQRVGQNTADRILKFDKRYKAFEIAGYFQKHREIIG